MGCDIHTYIESRRLIDKRWRSVTPRINPGRDYAMFGHLAGVRHDTPPVVEPRGVPADMAWAAGDDFYLLINDKFAGHERFVSLEEARKWEQHGAKIIDDEQGRPFKVERPDWHTPSWVTPDEFEQALKRDSQWEHDDVYWALLAAMRELERRGQIVRMVFWFDN